MRTVASLMARVLADPKAEETIAGIREEVRELSSHYPVPGLSTLVAA